MPLGRPFALVCFTLVGLGGCAGAVRTVEPGAGLDAVSRAAAGRTVTLVLRDGSTRRARSLALAPDTTVWTDAETGESFLTPTAALAEVQVRDRGRSAARTAGAGSLVGAGVGMALGASFCREAGGCGGFGVVLSTFLALGNAAGGAVLGAIGGASADRPDRYFLAPRGAPYRGDIVVPDRRADRPAPVPPAGQ